MSTSSIYQKFLRAAWRRLKQDYPYVSRFEKSFCVAIPKSSSFLLGRSPMNGKYFIIDFQRNPKPWQAGTFTINVHISTELVPTKNFHADDGYESAEDGYYRLASTCTRVDIWWCLSDRDRTHDESMREIDPRYDSSKEDETFFAQKWRPSSFESADTVIEEALEGVFALLDREVFDRFGFPARRLAQRADA